MQLIRLPFFFQARRFVGSYANVNHSVPRLRVPVYGFQLPRGSPAAEAATPAITLVCAFLLTANRPFQHIEQERVFRLQSGVLDPQLLQAGQHLIPRVVNRLELHSGVVENHLVQRVALGNQR